VLPNRLYSVRLDEGRVITAALERSFRHHVVMLLAGAKVKIKLAPVNPNRGQIIGKL
jgi:translation initiation factor IF-1